MYMSILAYSFEPVCQQKPTNFKDYILLLLCKLDAHHRSSPACPLSTTAGTGHFAICLHHGIHPMSL